jgi:hypothetical protein
MDKESIINEAIYRLEGLVNDDFHGVRSEVLSTIAIAMSMQEYITIKKVVGILEAEKANWCESDSPYKTIEHMIDEIM